MDLSLLDQFESYLNTHLPSVDSFHPHFNIALQTMLKAPAKRFRPMLLLTIVHSVTPGLTNNALPVALALEMLHTYSLIHDDLPAMDNAALRRGKQTLHCQYDETTAILVGDALNTHSFYLISKAPLSHETKIKLIERLSLNGGLNGMIIGQAIDCHFENQLLCEEQLTVLHQHKTGKLIASSLEMGSIIGNLGETCQKDLYQFGLNLGLLFQIQDDIIDQTFTQQEAGKTIDHDTNKNSFVNLLGLETAHEKADQLAQECKEQLNLFNRTDIKTNLTHLLTDYFHRHNKTKE